MVTAVVLIKAGEQLIVAGLQKIGDGAPVKPVS